MTPPPGAGWPRLEAVIFDVDGTIADTELHGHRVAFNRSFEEHGLPYRWDPEPYGELLRLPGGEERIERYLRGEGHDPEEAAALATTLQARKQELFLDLLAAGAVPLRTGIVRLVDELSAAGIAIGVATTGGRTWVLQLLDTLLGPERAARFGAIVTGEEVAMKKPDPEVYRIALERLGSSSGAALAIEDSAVGLEAARRAGLTCVVARNAYTLGHDFAGADLVVEELGDREAVTIVDNPHGIDVGPVVSLESLRAIHTARQAAS